MGIWEDGPPASFEIDGESDRVTFTVKEIGRELSNRIAKRERVYRNGERLDGMGTAGETIKTRSFFANTLKEPGVPSELYPGELDKLIELMKRSNGTTGTLRLPTTSPRRVKMVIASVHESPNAVDAAWLDVTWAEDSEETELESTFGKPNARSISVSLADDIVAQLEFMGVTSDDIAELKSIAAKLEELAQFSGERGDDLLQAAADATGAVDNIESSFLPSSQLLADEDFVVGETADSMLALPIAYSTLVSLRAWAEAAAEAAANIPGREVPEPKLYDHALSLFDIAEDNDVDIETLVELNPDLLDPGFIPANTPILLPGGT
jgi:hypothetical protein